MEVWNVAYWKCTKIIPFFSFSQLCPLADLLFLLSQRTATSLTKRSTFTNATLTSIERLTTVCCLVTDSVSYDEGDNQCKTLAQVEVSLACLCCARVVLCVCCVVRVLFCACVVLFRLMIAPVKSKGLYKSRSSILYWLKYWCECMRACMVRRPRQIWCTGLDAVCILARFLTTIWYKGL